MNNNKKIENQFRRVVLYALRFDKNGEKNVCTKQDFEKVINKDLMEQMDRPDQSKFIIQIQAFLNMCYDINSVLSIWIFFKSV